MICGVSDWCILYALFARVSSVWRDLSVKRSFFVTTSEFCHGTVTRAPESRPSSGANRPCRTSEAGQAVVRARFAVRRGSRCCQPADCGVFTSGNFCRDAVTRAPESRPSSGANRPCRTSEAGQAVVRARFAVRRGSRCCQPADCGVFTSGNFCRDAVTRAPESRPPSGANRPCRISGSRSGYGSRPLCRPARKSLLSVCRSWRFQRRELSSRRGYASA